MKIITRQQAIEQGVKRYFTGEPCKHGHVAERYSSSYACCECQRIVQSSVEGKDYLKNYNFANKNNARAYFINRVSDNPIKVKLQLKKAQCKKEGIPFNITEDDISIPVTCPLLGIPVVMTLGKGGSGRENGWSLDRLDASKGYVKGNVWVISGKANRMKQDMTPKMMRDFADVIECKIRDNHTAKNSLTNLLDLKS